MSRGDVQQVHSEMINQWVRHLMVHHHLSMLVSEERLQPLPDPVPEILQPGMRHRVLHLVLDHPEMLDHELVQSIFGTFANALPLLKGSLESRAHVRLKREMLIHVQHDAAGEKQLFELCAQALERARQRISAACVNGPQVVPAAGDSQKSPAKTPDHPAEALLGQTVQGSTARLTIAVGRKVCCLNHLKDSIHSAAQAAESRLVMGSDCVLDAETLPLQDKYPHDKLAPSVTWYAHLGTAVKLLDEKAIQTLIRAFGRERRYLLPAHPDVCLQLYKRLNLHLMLLFVEQHGYEPGAGDRAWNLDTCADCVELEQHLLNTAARIVRTIRESQLRKGTDVVGAACSYIAGHLDEHLSLAEVAEQIHFSPSYLGARFREEMDVPFTVYVRRQRMEMATALLKLPHLSVSEVAERVGYRDVRAFSAHFKQVVGVTPSMFRSRNVSPSSAG